MTAPVVWAQRKDDVFVTVNIQDAQGASVEIDETSFTFKGQSVNKDVTYNQRLELFSEIDPAQSRYVVRPRGTEIVLKKKDNSVWWPRLAKTTTKLHYVSVDWGKWVDSSDDEDQARNFEDFGWDENMGHQCGSSCSSDDDDGLEDVAPDDGAEEEKKEEPAATE